MCNETNRYAHQKLVLGQLEGVLECYVGENLRQDGNLSAEEAEKKNKKS